MKSYLMPTILLAVLSTAVFVSCHKERAPFADSTNIALPAPPSNNVYSDLPPVSGTDEVYYFLRPSTYPINCNNTYCTIRSRYILHSDGSFVLQYNYDGGNEYNKGIQYKGLYTKITNNVSLSWEGRSVTGSWTSTGTFRGDTLTVEYNTLMAMSDFEDAVYLRKR